MRILVMTIPTSYLHDIRAVPAHGRAPGGALGGARQHRPFGGRLRRLGHHPGGGAGPHRRGRPVRPAGPAGPRAPRRQGRRGAPRAADLRPRLSPTARSTCATACGRSATRTRPRSSNGDLDFAGYSLVTQITQLYLGGGELGELQRLAASSVQAIAPLRHEPALHYTRAVHQLILNLVVRGNRAFLAGEAYDEAATIAAHRDAKDSYGLGSAYR